MEVTNFFESFDFFNEISKFLDKRTLLTILSLSTTTKIYDDIFFDKWIVNFYANGKRRDFNKKLKKIKLNNSFNGNFNVLPKSIKLIILPPVYNYMICEDDLPTTLHTLILGTCYNKPIDNLLTSLPELKVLKLGYHFNQNLNNLPDSLEVLKLGGLFDKPIKKLPKSLKTLMLMNVSGLKVVNLSNITLQTLIISKASSSRNGKISLDNLPPTVRKLVLYKHPYGIINNWNKLILQKNINLFYRRKFKAGHWLITINK